MKYLYLSWNRLHNDIYKMSVKIEKTYKPDIIVAIARGGLTIAHILSDFLELPITSFTVISYADQKQVSVPKITFQLGNKLNNKKILLVDNISDTGKTFIRGIEYLKENGAQEIQTACPYIKPWTTCIPDFYHVTVDEWVIFPFDIKENIQSITKKLTKEGHTKQYVKKEMRKIKIPSNFVNCYR